MAQQSGTKGKKLVGKKGVMRLRGGGGSNEKRGRG